MTGKVIIKNISKNDIPEIVQIGLSTKELQVQDEGLYYYTKEVLEDFITSPNDIYLVAKVDGKIAGYRMATFNPYLKEAYLIDIVVKPEFRGKGISSLLYAKTFEILKKKDCKWVWALVREDNPKMIDIMKKKGFSKGTKLNFFYKVL